MNFLKIMAMSTILLLALKVFNVITFSYLWCLSPIIIMPFLFLFFTISKFKKGVSQLNEDLMKIGRNVSDKLNRTGYNIHTVQGFVKNSKNLIALNQYFSVGWDSGIKLKFELIDNKLKFVGYGAFAFRNDKYDTIENKKILENLIKDVENINI